MKRQRSEKPYFIASFSAHALVLLALILTYEFSEPMAVVENTNQHDVISAVVLGDTAKSKILPHEAPTPPPQPMAKAAPPAPSAPPKVVEKAIALKVDKTPPKPAVKKLSPAIFGKDLLADVAEQAKKVKVKNQKQLATKFEKLLKQQAEQSLRDHLLDDNIKLQGQESHLSQGIVNKYKALIIQAISEKWLVPPQSNKKLSSELLIRLAPGGVVLDVSVTKSSGDPALDSSARAAVLKASPLPVPPDAGAFESFRQFVLKVKPENVMDS
ncbi:MAG TPA: cell envelope integrity protein TolA [Gammaproteobacteria bacterium]|nr:cell envelope integrity protein TolA [Gammaproteobacteria bacterium]